MKGYFGDYGGRFVPETLVAALDELEKGYQEARKSTRFQHELKQLLRDYVGRPTPLYFAKHLTAHAGGAKIYLKREDLAHTGAHKINNTVAQVLLAKHLGKREVIAETGAGQHGVATATAAALLGLKCRVYMGEKDVLRQHPNVERMKLLGAEVVSVKQGARTLKDAINEALRDYVANSSRAHYVIGSVVGPHPYPKLVADFQQIIGKEARKQILAQEGHPPAAAIACVGGGSNALGLFQAFYDDPVKLIGVEAAGKGLRTDKHAATLVKGTKGILHGAKSKLLQDKHGQITEPHSVSAGLDYPGVGPEHAALQANKRAEYVAVTDKQALNAFSLLARTEGILCALESAHAIAYAVRYAKTLSKNKAIIVNLSGRGDKDLEHILSITGGNGNVK